MGATETGVGPPSSGLTKGGGVSKDDGAGTGRVMSNGWDRYVGAGVVGSAGPDRQVPPGLAGPDSARRQEGVRDKIFYLYLIYFTKSLTKFERTPINSK